MNLREEILKEHSKNQALYIANWVGADKTRFAELMRLFNGDEYRLTQRAAWVVSHVVDLHPALVEPYLSNLIQLIDSKVHDAVRRNAVRILAQQSLPKDLWGLAADKCLSRIADPNEAVAVRRYAMEVVWNICQKVPDLSIELRIILEDGLEHGSAGFRNYGQKLIREIDKRGWGG